MWVAPHAELDPSAVSLRAEGNNLGVEAVLRRYLPEGVALPAGMVVGRASLSASLRGSHLEPTLEVAAQLPDASASATAQLRRTAARLTLASPHADTAATLHLLPPSFEDIKAAVTQAQASALALPNVAGLDGEVGLRGLDVVPLLSGEAAARQLALQSGQPLRLKLNGKARVSGIVKRGMASTSSGWEFVGDLGLESVRVNQLKLFHKLAGSLSMSSGGVSVHGKGLRASETLDLDLALPLLGQHGALQQPASLNTDVEQSRSQAASDVATVEGVDSLPPAVDGSEEALVQPHARHGGGRLQMRCGPLQVAADINAAGSQMDFKVGRMGARAHQLGNQSRTHQAVSYLPPRLLP